ncbi:MAG TPA: hypothetical protein VGA37_16975 [Gemmatimonadales bacterium]
MRQYQVVLHKLQGGRQQEEESLTDLMNERERAGWGLHSSTALEPTRLMLVFVREA